MTSKIRVKMGAIEVEFEGSEKFLKEELLHLLSEISKLYHENREAIHGSTQEIFSPEDNGTGPIIGTTATIAGKLGCKSAPDLIIAAAAHLTLVQKKIEFSRKELLEQVKSAAGYYKESMGKNFTNYLNNRVKIKELIEPKTGYYALSADKKAELVRQLTG